jgi:superfamily II DNA helicase RecQ
MSHLGTPFLALTGTADESTEKEVSMSLNMVDHQRVFVSPNRTNLHFHVEKAQKACMLSQLDWIVDIVKENGVNTPKVIVFCSNLYAIASVMNYLMMQLGHNAFIHQHRVKENIV